MRTYGRWHRAWGTTILALATTLAVPAMTHAQETEPTPDADPVRIAYFSFAASNTYSQATLEGIEQVAEESGATVQAFDGGFDATVQVNAIQDALASGGFDAFIISSNDGNAVVPQVEAAIAAGIVVVATFTPIGPDLTTLEPQIDGVTATVGPPLVSNGEWFARLIVDACADRDPCQAAFMPGLSTLPLDAVRVTAMQAVLAEHPAVDLVAVVDGGYLADPAYQATQDILSAYPDIDVIATGGDQMTIGAELAVQDAGLADEIALIGNGASRPGVQAVRKGRWFGTYVNVPVQEGRTAADLAIRAVRGETVPSAVDEETLSPIGPVATLETVGDFEGEWEG
ncbi:ABC transporter substrate-binding protein [soil metagenome]